MKAGFKLNRDPHASASLGLGLKACVTIALIKTARKETCIILTT